MKLTDRRVAPQRAQQSVLTGTRADHENAHVGQNIGRGRRSDTPRRSGPWKPCQAYLMAVLLTVDELIPVLDSEAKNVAAEAERILPSDPVPSCPLWTVRDLIAHLGGAHRWAIDIVTRRLLQDSSEREQDALMAPPADPDELLPWFRSGVGVLIQTLTEAPDDLRAFVFLKGAPPARQFWARRQVHETTIHRVDVLAARLGRLPSTSEAAISPAVAVDGIDEIVAGFVPRRSSRLRTDEPFRMTIAPHDVDIAWTVAVSEQPPVVTRGVDPDAHATLTGSAAGIYLGLWNRGDDIAETGTVDALGHWREQVRIAWS